MENYKFEINREDYIISVTATESLLLELQNKAKELTRVILKNEQSYILANMPTYTLGLLIMECREEIRRRSENEIPQKAD